MDFYSIQRGDGYLAVHAVLKQIINDAQQTIENTEQSHIYLKINALHSLRIVKYIIMQSEIVEDQELSFKTNMIEDIEPVDEIIKLIVNKIKSIKPDSRQAFRVPTNFKQNQRKLEHKQVNVPIQKIKCSVDINTILSQEMQEEKKKLQREYIDKFSQLTFFSKRSPSPPNKQFSNTTPNLGNFKPWEISYAHFNAKQQSFMKIIKDQGDQELIDKHDEGRSKFFIRKILAKEAIKKASDKAEEQERERQIHPKESQNLYQKIVGCSSQANIRSSHNLKSVGDQTSQNADIEDCAENDEDEEENQQVYEFKDFFTTQIKQEGDQRIVKAYFRTIGVDSPSQLRPFDLKQKFPKVTIPKLVNVPLSVIKQKFQKDSIQIMEEKISKTGKSNKLDEALLKQMKNIRVRSNSPQNDARYTNKKVEERAQPHLKDTVKYLINPDLKRQEEARSSSPKIIPQVDFKQVTRFRNSNKREMK